MCTSYRVGEEQFNLFDAISEFPQPDFDYRREVYKDYSAPIVRLIDGEYRTDPASFGIVPRRHIPQGVRPFDTMNARAESITEKRSFSGAWKNLQLALIPASSIFEPCYETGKAVRWKIGLASQGPLAIAGLWRSWKEPDGTATSFTMLTLNGDDHPLMRRFHKPGAEKRSVVILPRPAWQDWLACTSTDEAWSFLRLLPADLMAAEPCPLPPRKKAEPDDAGQQSLSGM